MRDHTRKMEADEYGIIYPTGETLGPWAKGVATRVARAHNDCTDGADVLVAHWTVCQRLAEAGGTRIGRS